jgi:enamine deaminase RidA (YjgF/YER057c/UK114 family)
MEGSVFTKLTMAVLGFVLGAGWFMTTTAQPARRYINPRSAANPAAATQPPFSGAVLAGGTLYLSGMLGTGDSAEAAATSALTSIQNALKAADMTMDDLVSVQIFCSDVSQFDAFNKVYRTFFKQEYPARAFLGSGTLLNNARFEVQAIAVKR